MAMVPPKIANKDNGGKTILIAIDAKYIMFVQLGIPCVSSGKINWKIKI
jgi:hypothetical protein